MVREVEEEEGDVAGGRGRHGRATTRVSVHFPVDGPVDRGDTRSDTGGDTGADTGADTSVAEMSLGQLMEAVGQQVRLELASHTNAPPAPTVGGGAQDGSVEGVPVAGPTDVGRTLPQSGSGEIPCMHSIPACTLFGGS